MATDLRGIVLDLVGFYDLADKIVVAVGAGGGQLVEYARATRQVLAIDRDAAALQRLAERVAASGLAGKFTLLAGDLLELRPAGDVVLFEFCLHQMAEPARALAHARALAPDVVVIDHAPGSPWSWCAAEDAQVDAAWKAVERAAPRRQQDKQGVQDFAAYAELEAKLWAQGPRSLERIARHRDQLPISIPMPYRLALL